MTRAPGVHGTVPVARADTRLSAKNWVDSPPVDNGGGIKF